MKNRRWLITLLLCLVCVPAVAKERSLGTFGAWNAFAYQEGGQSVCYMVTNKTVKSTGPAKRSAPYLMITHRPVEGETDVFSYGAGTLLDTRRSVQIAVGKTSFDLFAARDIAWARDAQTDHRVARALRDGAQALAKATPTKPGRKQAAKPITDLFDLTGAPAAYHAIGKACGLPGDKAVKPVVKKKPAAKKAVAKAVKGHRHAPSP